MVGIIDGTSDGCIEGKSVGSIDGCDDNMKEGSIVGI